MAATAAMPAAADAAWPGLNGRISLTQRAPEGAERPRANRDIFAYSRGAEPAIARLTTDPENEEQSAWSADGQWVTFKRGNAVWVSRVDGSGLRALHETAADRVNHTQPGWSPDGARLIFRDNRDRAPANVGDIWVIDFDGSHEHAVLKRPGDERYPTFSPDGTRILFRGDDDSVEASGDEELFVMHADGTGVVALTDDDVVDSAPAWSPDGSRIAFESERDGTDREIYVMDADGTDVVRLTDNDVHDEGPAWSPDGRLLAFSRGDSPTAQSDVWVMESDGADPVAIAASSLPEESPDWQPLPFAAGTHGLPQAACGDLSLLPGGVSSVMAVHTPCAQALAVARAWEQGAALGAPPRRVQGFRCSRRPHSFDQVVVECDHRGFEKGVAFVHREALPGA